MFLKVVVANSFLCAVASALFAEGFVHYTYVAGDTITNESFSVSLFPCSTEYKSVKAEDMGNQTKMTRSVCKTISDTSVPRELVLRLAALITNRVNFGVSKRGGSRADITVSVDDNHIYYCSFYNDAFNDDEVVKIHNELYKQGLGVIRDNRNTVSKFSCFIDKPYVSAITVDVSTVVSAPLKHLGKNVVLSGYYWKYEGGPAIFNGPPKLLDSYPRYPYEKSVWVCSFLNEEAKTKLKKCGSSIAHVRVEGLIYAEVENGRTRAGDLGLWPLEIMDISSVTIIED